MERNDPQSNTLSTFLSKLGLDTFYPNKLTLQSLLEIKQCSLMDEVVDSVDKIPQCFLRKLFRINADCRSCVQLPDNSDNDEDAIDLLDFDLDPAGGSADNKINPLDLIVAVFLCADSFLQQEMASKMSMCQLSVPLLLPHSGTSQCSLMLWALRDIVKEWRPQELCEAKGFVKNSLLLENLPIYSFVRLKHCSLSKSQLLNHVLSCGQQNHNIFIHRDMMGGAHDRRLANGLVEVCWSLPSGTKNLDKFPEPVGFANLRGHISESFLQFSFLCQVSARIFVLLDKVEEEEHKILTSLQDLKTKLVLVLNYTQGVSKQDVLSFQTLKKDLNLPDSRVIIRKPNLNVADFSEKLYASIKESMRSGEFKVNIENLRDKAVGLGLSVDETTSDDQKKEAAKSLNGIRVNKIKVYKEQQLPLQGDKWKRLSELEMEECRLKKCSKTGIEEYKCELQAEKENIRNEQSKYKLSKAMTCFTQHVSVETENKGTKQSHEQKEAAREKRDFFLKWMQILLNAHVHTDTQLSILRSNIKKQSSQKKKDEKLIAELYQELLDSSLGIEHYMREMGLIYEFCTNRTDEDISRLPAVAAQMLLDGHPIELLDGDASNIPETWVTDVLTELHNKVGGRSRLLVLTVLGVQSTGKSTLLNTMFGVQFSVSSGRCTRGAYMLFLRVGDDVKDDLNCDFIVLIDTEGLRSPLLGLPEETLEHDNQLATFVIGLSDVTIINVAMEQSTEMQDTLQIATHAFLRMNEIGKKPVCHFVHQNVAAVSANDKNMNERQKLLDQLNEMAKEASVMENLPKICEFTDVMDYDIDKNNWNIPGLWHGTPPMAPVNTGYSEAVADLKKHLLRTMGDRGRQASQIPEFLEWIKSLWKAVKYENFLFSFRSSLVANAYDNLCIEFNRWEWELRKKKFTWQRAAELEILTADTTNIQVLKASIESKKSEVSQQLIDEETQMIQKLENYYERKDANVNLIEKYRNDFLNSIKSIANEIRLSVHNKLDQTLHLKKCSKELQEKMEKYREVIEEQVMTLVSDGQQSSLSDEQLKAKFEQMWAKETQKMSGLEEQNICDSIIKVMKGSFLNRKVNEFFQDIGDLKQIGKGPFQAKDEHIKCFSLSRFLKFQTETIGDLQKIADEIIESCRKSLADVTETNSDYHESLTKDLLDKIEKFLKTHKKQCRTRFEFDLKLHICGIASREFLKMHQKFLKDNDPRTQLDKFKTQYMTDFLHLYKQSSTDKADNCEHKANGFVQFCIKPGVVEYIDRSLGIDIVDEILEKSNSSEFSSRSFFQYHIMKELLLKRHFQSFVRYISTYEVYVKDWIRDHILQTMSENQTLSKLRKKKLQVIIPKISLALTQAAQRADGTSLPDDEESTTELVENILTRLNKDLLIPVEAVNVTLFQIHSKCHSFISSLRVALDELTKQLQEEFSESTCKVVTETLDKLPVKPQDELFQRVFGCGHQCPFCNVPCEVGVKDHKQHRAAVHRPQGLGRYSNMDTNTLVEQLCTTDVQSSAEFRNQDTQYQWHPYKEYATYYPEWHIPPDNTTEASDYWKHVLVKYNKDFASEYEAKPANVPEAWKTITEEQVLKGLKDAFNVI